MVNALSRLGVAAAGANHESKLLPADVLGGKEPSNRDVKICTEYIVIFI